MTVGPLSAALRGLRVADFSTHLPGPFATARLSELGATVLKIEPPGGDPARHMFDGSIFDEVNAGKRSIELDLRDEEDHRVARELCRDADVIIEGFRPSIAERLRVVPSALWPEAGAEPRLFMSIRTSSTDLEFASGRAHDVNVVARSGLMMVPVTWSQRDSLPLRPALPLADIAAGEEATRQVLAWAVQRGSGAAHGVTCLTVGMLESLQPWVSIREVTYKDGEPTHLDPANDVYLTADGRWLTVTALEDPAWRRMCRILPLQQSERDLLEGLTAPGRLAQGDVVARLLREALAQEPAAHWLAVLGDAGVSLGEVCPPRTPDRIRRGPALGELDVSAIRSGDLWGSIEG